VKPKEPELRPFADRFESPAPPRFGVGEELYFSMPEEDFPTKRPKGQRRLAMAVVLVGLVAGGALGVRRYLMPGAVVARTGTLVVNTDPVGVPVTVDGQQKGVTPLTLTLAAGPHVLGLLASEEPRTVPVTVTAGTELSQYFELRRTDVARGQLQVRTDPPGAKVTLDGRVLGTSPVSADDLTPGVHTIVLENEFRVVTETVTIEGGATASLVVPLGQAQSAAAAPGWVSLVAPVDMQLFENGRLLGTSRGERIVLSTGRHDLEIVNEALQYRATRTIQVVAGKMSPIKLDWPKGTIALNAVPWADVWIDGEKIGETPIGSVSLPIGPHEVIFRNPDLGERKYTTTITAGSSARLSADFSTK
jgi:hypothetical protein